jgi:hypothetical protein
MAFVATRGTASSTQARAACGARRVDRVANGVNAADNSTTTTVPLDVLRTT